MPRRLGPEERALWAKVVETVRPFHAQAVESAPIASEPEVKKAPLKVAAAVRRPPPPAKVRPGTTLDGSWDRRLSRGLVSPEMSLDLHGHNLATAYSLLDERLDRAISQGVRTLLLITGKAPSGEPPVARGRIRAAIGDWLAASRHAGDIAAVRNAHPRHGGAGALYIILRRAK